MNQYFCIIQLFLAILLAPLLIGIINRTKAVFAGRKGQPLLQPYFEIIKLLQKDYVYSETITWIFKISPSLILASLLVIIAMIPSAGNYSLISFSGDIILILYLLGLIRFFIISSALDTGSAFEGMGASREAFFSILAEPATFLSVIALSYQTKSYSLSEILLKISWETWGEFFSPLILVVISLFIVLLAENSRIPFDDPNTHLELTMIHEVMVLDHSGPDFAFILYSSALKIWVLGSVIVNILLPVHSSELWVNQLVFLGGMSALAVLIGITESVMARLRLFRIPKLLISASFMSIMALIFIIR